MICITLLNLVGEILVFVKKYKLKKEYQKYDVDVLDTVNYGVIIAILIVVIYRIFSADLNFNYINTDPAVHFGQAVKFAIKGKVSNMPYSAVFNGTFIKLFLCIFPGVKTYKVFILADSFSNFLSGAFFYILFKEIVTNKVVKKLSPLFTALYFVGWPVYNYVQGGFVYWGMGAYLIMFGLYLIIKHNKDEISLKVLFCALFDRYVSLLYDVCPIRSCNVWCCIITDVLE